MACATTMACHEGLSGSEDGTVERARLGDGLEERDFEISDKMGSLRVNCPKLSLLESRVLYFS